MKDSTRRDDSHDQSKEEHREQVTALLEEVREDAQHAPARYLKETIVPAGGE